jgi:hypothetical protein
MAHITFIHGIGNKPPEEQLLRQWRTALLDDDGLDLDDLGVSSSMVYWADVLYETPMVGAGNESNVLELAGSVDAEDADFAWLANVSELEQEFVEGLAIGLGFGSLSASADTGNDPVMSDTPLEAVPLPGPLKRRLMRVLLRDVHHFLFDTKFSPRPGDEYHVRQEIRRRVLDALTAGSERPRPHVLVGHSLGSVIAYDGLTGAQGAPAVDTLVTLGSPLGISEVQDGLTPPWSRHDGWPSERLGSGGWANFYDPLDPVCGGLDRLLGPDYRLSGSKHVADVHVTNSGSWRHSVEKYFGQGALRDWLERAVTGLTPTGVQHV